MEADVDDAKSPPFGIAAFRVVVDAAKRMDDDLRKAVDGCFPNDFPDDQAPALTH